MVGSAKNVYLVEFFCTIQSNKHLRAGVTGPGPGVGPVPFVPDPGIWHTNLPFIDMRTEGGQQFGRGKRQGVGGHLESDGIVAGPL